MVLALEARALSKRYGRRRWALHDVEVSIPGGRVTALVGPNAAGKSTLIRTWVGFERPTAGSVRVAGHDPWQDRRSALAALSYVPQGAQLYDALTVTQHLKMVGRLRPGFRETLAEARLQDLAIPQSAPGRELSGGQQAQVMLAMALGTPANILLLDEPLAHLDPLVRLEFLRVVRRAVKEEGRTVLLSSHVVSDIERSCDDLLLLGIGRVLLHAPIDEVLARHSVALDGQVERDVIAEFTSADGSTTCLLASPAARQANRRPASLEEVVLGHLTAARGDAR